MACSRGRPIIVCRQEPNTYIYNTNLCNEQIIFCVKYINPQKILTVAVVDSKNIYIFKFAIFKSYFIKVCRISLSVIIFPYNRIYNCWFIYALF